MGVDSGLPDYRGDTGFWTNYLAYLDANISYEQAASGRTFFTDPELAWGIYGHRLNLYRKTSPHIGFDILKKWADALPLPSFVFTSNIDGQFQKAGFSEEYLHECHGSVHHLQCSQGCTEAVWSAHNVQPVLDKRTLRWTGPLPTCPHCGKLARPNVLMFHDANWVTSKDRLQENQLRKWRTQVKRPVCIELGAGLEIPRVRNLSQLFSLRLIRINPADSTVRPSEIGLKLGAADALTRLDALISTTPT